ncbi:MAG: response regulator, partial [Myxococcota bacterium]
PSTRRAGDATLTEEPPLSRPIHAPALLADTEVRAAPSPEELAALATDYDRTLLIVEDDVDFARVLPELAAQFRFRSIIASTAAEALSLARRYRPDAIALDVRLPDRSGWTVLEALKRDPQLRSAPVLVVTVLEDAHRAYHLGAAGFLRKPVSREALERTIQQLRLLVDRPERVVSVVGPPGPDRQAVVDLLTLPDVRVEAFDGEADAVGFGGPVDCAVVLHAAGNGSPRQFIARLRSKPETANMPVIVWRAAGADVSRELKAAAEVIDAMPDNEGQLLESVTLHLHLPEERIPEDRRERMHRWRASEPVLRGRKVLLVDDDVRNLFALSTVLEQRGMIVEHAESGRAALEALRKRPDTDIVLMDVMMPEMDGHTATRMIRTTPGIAQIPVICITAKAMRGDREACLASGATDYISKPVDIEHLLSLLRVWLVEAG